MQLLTAKNLIDSTLPKLKKDCQQLIDSGVTPYLKVILVGNHTPSLIYTRNKKKFAHKIGAKCDIVHLNETISEQEFLKELNSCVEDNKVHGILVQLPLPTHLGHLVSQIAHLIPPEKDVDGFNPNNLYQLLKGGTGDNSLIPCTPKGIMSLINYYNIPVTGQNIVVIGRSLIVGKPLSQLLENYNATLTLCHLQTKNIQRFTRMADIIIIAAGDPRFFGKEYFRDDKTQYIIDVGMNKDQNGKLCGDVDFEQVASMVKAITPVPGGIGPMTIFSLIQNLLLAAKKSV